MQDIEIDCPWCGKHISKQVSEGAPVQVEVPQLNLPQIQFGQLENQQLAPQDFSALFGEHK